MYRSVLGLLLHLLPQLKGQDECLLGCEVDLGLQPNALELSYVLPETRNLVLLYFQLRQGKGGGGGGRVDGCKEPQSAIGLDWTSNGESGREGQGSPVLRALLAAGPWLNTLDFFRSASKASAVKQGQCMTSGYNSSQGGVGAYRYICQSYNVI